MPAVVNASTGIAGLDQILDGGLPRDRIYLVQGDPGVGKTTIGLHFLRAGLAVGERCLYIALSESREELTSVVESHGWTLDGISVVELSALEQSTGLEAENTLFESAEVELHETTRRLLGHVERVKPERVVLDSLSELRLLAQSALRYRRQILALKQYFTDKRTTVLLLDDRTSEAADLQLQSLAHGVVTLEQVAPSYGAERRRLRVAKLRGRKFRGGYHELVIRTGGVEVFPRLGDGRHAEDTFVPASISSGLASLDALLGGGLDRGTATLVIGPAGSGKSSVCVQYAVAAAARGEQVGLFMFDERLGTLTLRSRALGCDVERHIGTGLIHVRQVDPAEMGAGEFAHVVRRSVEDGARVIVIDSLNGYLNTAADDHELIVQMHELLAYLGHRGVTTLLVMAQHGLVGSMHAPIDVSYLADTVLLLRYFEAAGRIRKAISVLKKRSGRHEDAIRELALDERGIHVGAPLAQFEGVLTGVPKFVGNLGELKRG